MANDCIPLPKGAYAIAHVQSSYYTLHTGTSHYSRYFVVRVVSSNCRGIVKTFVDSEGSTPKRNDRFVTIYSLSDKHLKAAELLFAKQPRDFSGYVDKEHLRLALVNVEIAAAA